MSLIEVVVWSWTISAVPGLLVCGYGLWNAWLDWKLVVGHQVNGRTRAIARQGLLNSTFFTVMQAVALSIGAVLLMRLEPFARYWPLGLLTVQVSAVVLSVLDTRTRAYLMRAPADRRQHDVGPPNGVERRH